jgi:hypothetical protein
LAAGRCHFELGVRLVGGLRAKLAGRETLPNGDPAKTEAKAKSTALGDCCVLVALWGTVADMKQQRDLC